MGGGLFRRRGDSTTLLGRKDEHQDKWMVKLPSPVLHLLNSPGKGESYLCFFLPCLVSMELMDSRSSGALFPGKLLFLLGSVTSFSIIITRSSVRRSLALSSSLGFILPGWRHRMASVLSPGPSMCWKRVDLI